MREAQKPQDSAKAPAASDIFDEAYYRRRYSDIGDEDAFHHFMTVGGWEGRKCSDRFDAGWYLVNYDDVTVGGLHPLDHYMNVGIHEDRKTGLTDQQVSLLHSLFDQFAEIDPAILHEAQFRYLDRTPYVVGVERSRLHDTWKSIFASLKKPYAKLIFAGFIGHHETERVAADVMKVLGESDGLDDALIVFTDFVESNALELLPAGTNSISFSDFRADLSPEERTELVEYLISAIQPDAVMNVESIACWNALRRRGAAFSQITKLFAYVSEDSGFSATHLSASHKHLIRAYFDTLKLLRATADQLRLEDVSQFALFEKTSPREESIRKAMSAEPSLLNAGPALRR